MAKSVFLFPVLAVLFLDVVQGQSNRIVSGEVASAGEFPWQVSLRTDSRHFCGGSLVSLQHVLTAGHCVADREASSIVVVSGTNSLAIGGEEHIVRTIFIHAGYSSPAAAYHVNDVSVLVLNAPVTESLLQRPILLPIEEVPDGSEAIVSGWGRTLPGSQSLPTSLQKLKVMIINATDCQTQWSDVAILDDHLCAEQEYGAGVCNGDSGGALVFDNRIVGIVSWANPCGFDYPDVYTYVYDHLLWIGQRVYNTETETTTTTTTTPAPGSSQVSLTDGNYVLLILCIFAVIQKLFLSD